VTCITHGRFIYPVPIKEKGRGCSPDLLEIWRPRLHWQQRVRKTSPVFPTRKLSHSKPVQTLSASLASYVRNSPSCACGVCDILPRMACDQLVRMRLSLRELHAEAKRRRTGARQAAEANRRADYRGGSDALVYMQRRLHRATAELEQHILVHNCQE